MTLLSKREALCLLHLPTLPHLSSPLSSRLSPSPPPVCSRRLPLTAGDVAVQSALTVSSAGLGRWADVTSAVLVLPAPVSSVTQSLW